MNASAGTPLVMLVQVLPKSVVLKAYGAKSSILCRCTETDAVPALYMDASIMLTVPHSGIVLGVTLAQFFPPSVVTCTRPSSEPAQIRSFCIGDSTTEKMVSYTSTPVLSLVIGPPDATCLLLSLRVRSGLMICQFTPSSVDLKRTCAAKYKVLGSCGENTIGSVHWKRYFWSAAAAPIGLIGHGVTFCVSSVRWS